MYFAICDDNIADRKQSERLLKRQAERVQTEFNEQVYVDSFGNKEAFLIRPQMYQAMFIDMTTEEPDGLAIAKKLLDIGITKPIVLCCSSIDYKKRRKSKKSKQRICILSISPSKFRNSPSLSIISWL